ncbi:geranylgeranylglyceryl/heptaprenylglyceryl phosphate synthase [Hanstruepera ponticola]|uniref:geranylgeranylglyceryl/heptaprenylglyceryl phosphate synthase n=1 Tax=Hanstruepera ponticola TaxID=2042995 RepID=UPI000CF0BC22|nr:geranylgeranylglyceryl/heptaprenylglyceryl phosphate synthase [Hanstruepera ponticola]
MKNIYNNILQSISNDEKLLAVLIDPDKFSISTAEGFLNRVNKSVATHIFVGGSEVEGQQTGILVKALRRFTQLPIILFPGDVTQVTNEADGILFLSLISGRNSEYLIGKHVKSVSRLSETELEIIPTGYMLIENGKETAVERVTGTKPLSRVNIQLIEDTAKAGEFLGMKLMYLEAGSGATHPVTAEIISKVKKNIQIPLIVGGGIRTKQQLDEAYNFGADLVVIGTAFEENESFFDSLKKKI